MSRDLKEEMNIISERGFSKYFLTMKSIADKATEVQLTGAGRGSAAGSLLLMLSALHRSTLSNIIFYSLVL